MIDEVRSSAIQPSSCEQEARRLLSVVNSESIATRHAWLLFMGLMVYFIVAITSVTHTDLLLNSPVRLPFLNIGIPLTAFFTFGPPALLFVHLGVLVQHVLLSDKLNELDGLLKRAELESGLPSDALRQQLDSYFFTQHLAGRPRKKLLTVFLRALTAISLSILPIFLLLYFQISFLPYHDYAVTWFHRLYLVADILLILVLRARMGATEVTDLWSAVTRFGRYSVFAGIRLAVAVTALFLSFFIATIPSSVWERNMNNTSSCLTNFNNCRKLFLPQKTGSACSAERSRTFALTAYLFDGDIDPGTGTSKSIFSRNLIVTDKRSLQAAMAGDEDGGRSGMTSNNHAMGSDSVSLRGRNLCYATLDRSNFRGVDLTAADLTGASLKGADLRDARLSCAVIPRTKGITGGHDEYRVCTQLKGADLSGANLEATDLRGVKLMNATLIETIFRQANLSGGLLNGADLSFANLERASLVEASLVNATFLESNLQGADLRFARLEGARLRKADLMGANLLLARAEGATFSFANLQGASLNLAWLQGADFESAKLEGADLRNAELQGASFKTAILEGADLKSAKLQGANFKGASINFADLRHAKLWATSPPVASSKTNMLADLRDLDFRKFPQRDRATLKNISATLMKTLKPTTGQTRRLSDYHAIRRLTPLLDTSKFENWKCSDGNCPDYQTWDYLRKLTDTNTERRGKLLGSRLAILACKDTSAAGYLALGLIRRVARSSPAGVPACLLEVFQRNQITRPDKSEQPEYSPLQSRGLPCPKESLEFIRQYVPRCPVATRLAKDPNESEKMTFRYLETLRLAAEKQAREKASQDWAEKQAKGENGTGK